MPSQVKTAVAVFLAAFAGCLAITPLIGSYGAGCAFPIAVAVLAVVGVPITLRCFSAKTRWWQVALAGLAVGALPFLSLDAYWAVADWRYHTDLRWQARFTAAGAICGCITAGVFWLVAGREFFSPYTDQHAEVVSRTNREEK